MKNLFNGSSALVAMQHFYDGRELITQGWRNQDRAGRRAVVALAGLVLAGVLAVVLGLKMVLGSLFGGGEYLSLGEKVTQHNGGTIAVMDSKVVIEPVTTGPGTGTGGAGDVDKAPDLAAGEGRQLMCFEALYDNRASVGYLKVDSDVGWYVVDAQGNQAEYSRTWIAQGAIGERLVREVRTPRMLEEGESLLLNICTDYTGPGLWTIQHGPSDAVWQVRASGQLVQIQGEDGTGGTGTPGGTDGTDGTGGAGDTRDTWDTLSGKGTESLADEMVAPVIAESTRGAGGAGTEGDLPRSPLGAGDLGDLWDREESGTREVAKTREIKGSEKTEGTGQVEEPEPVRDQVLDRVRN